jgi:hypothetical protein
MIYIVSKHRYKTWHYHLPFNRFRRLRTCSCQSRIGPNSGIHRESVVPENNPETPCLLQRDKKVVLVVQWRTVMCPALRLNTTQGCVDVKPRCHGDTSGTSKDLAYKQHLTKQTSEELPLVAFCRVSVWLPWFLEYHLSNDINVEVGATVNKDACAQANSGQGGFLRTWRLPMTLLLSAIRSIS